MTARPGGSTFFNASRSCRHRSRLPRPASRASGRVLERGTRQVPRGRPRTCCGPRRPTWCCCARWISEWRVRASTTRPVGSPALFGLGHVFGVEFVELGLGDARERKWHAGDENRQGLHGGAILAGRELDRPALIRIDAGGTWFDGSRDEPRIGGRIAVAGKTEVGGQSVAFVSTHLESHSDPDDRAKQTRALLDAIGRLSRGWSGDPRRRLQHHQRLVSRPQMAIRERRSWSVRTRAGFSFPSPMNPCSRCCGRAATTGPPATPRTCDTAHAAGRDSGTAPRPHRLVLHPRAHRPGPGHGRGRRLRRHGHLGPRVDCSHHRTGLRSRPGLPKLRSAEGCPRPSVRDGRTRHSARAGTFRTGACGHRPAGRFAALHGAGIGLIGACRRG